MEVFFDYAMRGLARVGASTSRFRAPSDLRAALTAAGERGAVLLVYLVASCVARFNQ